MNYVRSAVSNLQKSGGKLILSFEVGVF